ncbi:hypothetical protein [Metabacillus fastidiosus]|uniref:hypothetical protein n=1 Tax=Metabacillus fastidiosus TaxID=1458 RepID=UPI003D26F42B
MNLFYVFFYFSLQCSITYIGKVVIIFVMFLGKLGPLSEYGLFTCYPFREESALSE